MIENVTKNPLFQDHNTAGFQPRDLFDLCLPPNDPSQVTNQNVAGFNPSEIKSFTW